MRLLKFFSLIAVFAITASYVSADEVSEDIFSNSVQQEEIGLNEEPISYNNSTEECTDTEKLPPYDQGYSIEEDQMMSAYNAPARIDVTNSWDAFIKGSFIYWLPKLKGMEYAITRPADYNTNVNAVSPPVNRVYKLHNVSQSDYKPGFKLALGTNLAHDNWTMMIEYVRLTGTNSSSVSLSTYSWLNFPERLVSLWIDSSLEHNTPTDATSGPFMHLTGKLETKYNMFNLEFARPLYESTCLTMRPFFGLTSGWIDFDFTTVGKIQDSLLLIKGIAHSNSWLLGPRTGLDGQWILGAGFDLEADVAGALAYQSITVDYKQSSAEFSDHYSRLGNKDYSQITPVLEGNLGLGWGTYFADNSWHFSVKALYEFIYYFEQNYMRKVSSQILNSTVLSARGTSGVVNSRSNSDLEDFFMHGLTITARLDF